MRLDTPINAADYVSDKSYDLVPPGWYVARITDSTVKATKAGTGKYISVRYDIIGPTHQGRVIFGSLHISNPNAAAERIGREQLSDLLRSIGLATLSDTQQLIGATCQIKVAIQAGNDGYQDRNEVKGWKVTSDAVRGPQVVGAAVSLATPSEAASAKAAPPWARKGA